MHVFEMGVSGVAYLFVIWWVFSNLADDKEEKTQRDFGKVDKES
jgi:hypothetical protein